MNIVSSNRTRAARVLVVDDERHIARFLEFVLNKAGYEVAVAHDGEEALAVVKQFAPDAMLLDLVMPKLSGLEVLTQLRADEKYDGLVIAVLTARSFEDMSGEIITAGANIHCEKPVAPSTLLKRLLDLGISPLVDENNENPPRRNEGDEEGSEKSSCSSFLRGGFFAGDQRGRL